MFEAPKDRHARAAVAFAENRLDDALEDIVDPVFGDVPPYPLVQRVFEHPRNERIWRNRIERTFIPWLAEVDSVTIRRKGGEETLKLTDHDKFHICREISNAFHLKLRPKPPGKRRKYRKRAG